MLTNASKTGFPTSLQFESPMRSASDSLVPTEDLRAQDLRQLAKLHVVSLPDTALGRLGWRYTTLFMLTFLGRITSMSSYVIKMMSRLAQSL